MKLVSNLKSKMQHSKQSVDNSNQDAILVNLIEEPEPSASWLQTIKLSWRKSLTETFKQARKSSVKLLPTKSIRRLAIVGLCALMISTSIIPILGIIMPSQVQAGWWNEDYGYRQIIEVESDDDQASVYINISLDTSDELRFQNDCRDIRFITQSGELLPHYVVSGCGTNDTDIQVLVSSLSAGDSIIYAYYGNPQAKDIGVIESFNNLADSVNITLSSEERSASPIAYWKFDEGFGDTTQSSTTGDFPGVLEGNASWQSEDKCVRGKCLKFDGSTDTSVGIAAYEALDPYPAAPDFSWSLWFKTTNLGDLMTTADSNAFGFNRGYGLTIAGWPGCVGQLFFSMSDGTDREDICAPGRVDDGRWHHVVVSVERESEIVIYVDGRQAAQRSSVIDGLVYHHWMYLSPNIWESAFIGSMDEVKFYHNIRTLQQVQSEYVAGMQSLNQQLANLNDGLVAHWQMNEASWSGASEEVEDVSDSFIHGQSFNGASIGGGKYGNSAILDGVDDYIRMPNPSIGGSSSNIFTFSTWFKPGAQSGFILGPHSNGFDNYIGYDSTNKKINIRIAEAEDSNERTLSSTNNSVSDSDWNHLAVSIEDKTVKIYLNGKLNATFTETISIANWSTSGYWDLGQRGNNTSRFLGSIDDARVYNRILNMQEVGQLYHFSGAPRVDVDFNEVSGATAYDRSGNGFDVEITTSRTDGKSGGGLLADGDEGGRINSNLYFDKQNFTIMTWVKSANDTEGQQRIFGSELDDNDSFMWFDLDYGVPVLEYWFDDTGPVWIESDGGSIADNNWHHVAIVVDRDQDKQQIFVDGAVQAENIGELTGKFGDSTNTDSFRLGYHSGSLPEFSLDGVLDDFKVYDYAMSPFQLNQAMQGSGIQNFKPTSHWKLNEKTGSVATDSGLLGVDGAITSCDWSTSGPGGTSVECDGSGYVEIEPNAAYSSPDFSMSFWLKLGELNEGGPYGNMILDYDDYLVAGFRMGLDNDYDGTLDFWTTQNGGDLELWGSKPLSDDKWHHVAITYDSRRQLATSYIDGVFEQSDTGVYIPPTNEYIYINGSGGGTTHSNSSFSDVKFFNYSLSPQQVAVDYNKSSAFVAGAASTNPTTKLPSNEQDSRYCVPGDESACAAPVAHFDFEEGSGSTVKDISGNGHDGTWSGSTDRYGIGKIGKSGKFDGSTSGVQITAGDNSALDGENGFSYSLWLKRPDASSSEWPTILSQSDTHEGYGLVSTEFGTRVMFEYGLSPYDGSTQERILCEVGHLPINEWHHFAVTYDGAIVRLYQNGILCDLDTVTLNPTFQSTLNMMSGAGFYNGMLDEVRIYDYARTQAQVVWDFNYGKPVIHYKFNECQGGTAHDSATLGFHATLDLGSLGNTTIGTCNNPSSAWGLGKIGKDAGAMSFDGLDDFAVADYDVNPELRENYSVSAWIKPADADRELTILGYDFGPEFMFFVDEDNSLSIRAYIGYSAEWPDYDWSTNPGLVKMGEWQHVAVTVKGTTISLYYNGQLAASGTIATTEPSGYSSPLLTIGQTGADWMHYWFEGLMDDLQIHNYALTAEQMKVIYNGGAVRWGQYAL